MNDVSNIITKLAISSQFKVSLNLNRGSSDGDLHGHLTRCGIFDNLGASYESYDLLCSQASLPSSTNFILEERGSRQGVIEKFATYRVYDNFSLTFYCIFTLEKFLIIKSSRIDINVFSDIIINYFQFLYFF